MPGIHDQLLEEFVPAAPSLVVGDLAEGDPVEMGLVISACQRDRVLGFVDRATDAGAVAHRRRQGREARLLCRPDGYRGCGPARRDRPAGGVGPVATVQSANSVAQAVEFANDVRYGLAASVWTRDVGLAMEAVRQLDFGCV